MSLRAVLSSQRLERAFLGLADASFLLKRALAARIDSGCSLVAAWNGLELPIWHHVCMGRLLALDCSKASGRLTSNEGWGKASRGWFAIEGTPMQIDYNVSPDGLQPSLESTRRTRGARCVRALLAVAFVTGCSDDGDDGPIYDGDYDSGTSTGGYDSGRTEESTETETASTSGASSTEGSTSGETIDAGVTSNTDTQSGDTGTGGTTSDEGDAGSSDSDPDGGMPIDDEVQELLDLYVPQSMLHQADQYALEVIGDRSQWSGQYLDPEPDELRETSSAFLTIYPRAYLPEAGKSTIGTLASSELWEALQEIGITLMHPVAFEKAGQLFGKELRPSIDGGFDRISMDIEPGFGTESEVRDLVSAAMAHDALIAGDVIPLHTGLGADFRLAEMNYQDYPGVYDMIEIREKDWGLLPPVDERWGFEVITNEAAQPIIEAGYMPGTFDVLLGAEESVDWSGWAATGEVPGVDGKTRRWIYAHLFKPEQPTLNWMDPSYAGRRTQTGDIVRHLELGVRVNRLDAVPFLALNPAPDSDSIQYYSTDLAIAGTNDLAYMHRKLGGWTWVELNVPTDSYVRFMRNGADLGYDFFTRVQTVHPLITRDARVLRVAHRSILDAGLQHRDLIHAMQNHDEIAYQLINLSTQDQVQLGDETLSGTELQERTLEEMRAAVAGEAAPYNALYRPANNGVATTFCGFIAPALGIDPYDASDDEVSVIRRAHVLLAHVGAMQPGVFAVSQWDLVGALPIDRSQVEERISEGDMRWLNRGAVDLMGTAEDDETLFGLPRAPTLYPPLPQQLADANSFASQLSNILAARREYGIASATMVAVPQVSQQALLVLVMTLPADVGGIAVTVINYGDSDVNMTLDLTSIFSPSDLEDISGTPHDVIADSDTGSLTDGTLTVPVAALSGRTIAVGDVAIGSGGGS